MTFTLHVEHEIIDGTTVLETFEGVESFQNPPMTSNIHIQFADGNGKKLSYGHVAQAIDGTSDHDTN